MTHLNLSDLAESMYFWKYLVMYLHQLEMKTLILTSDSPRIRASLEMKAYLKEETTDDSPLR